MKSLKRIRWVRSFSIFGLLALNTMMFQNCAEYKSIDTYEGATSLAETPSEGEPTPPAPTVPGTPAVQNAWPDASNTGVPTGTVLTNYTGPMTVTQNGTVIDGKIINGDIVIRAANVVIKNSRIMQRSYWGVDFENASNFTIQDCDIVGPGLAGTGNSGLFGSGTILRNDISGAENGINLSSGSSVIKGNYIHDLKAPGTDPHYDGIQVFGGQNGVLIEDNTIIASDTSDVFISNIFGSVSNVTVNHNYLAGSVGINIYVEGNRGNGTTTGVSLTNNTMEKGYYGYYSIVQSNPTLSGNILLP